MSPARRSPPRTAAAVVEDLMAARRHGGLHRATERDLEATIDLLLLASHAAHGESPLTRARDLLISYVRRGCSRYAAETKDDSTAQAAAVSLEALVLRPGSDKRMAQVIRRETVRAIGHSVSADAVRHREDRIISKIAEAVCSDLLQQSSDEPQTLEAAIHVLMPQVIDLRQELHDGLCLTYPPHPPADPREAKAIDGFHRQVIIKLGKLLLATRRVAKLGLQAAPNEDEYFFVRHARWINGYLFDEEDDRQFMVHFTETVQDVDWPDQHQQLLSAEGGPAVFDRWLTWIQCCMPTCAFERTTDLLIMCSPHQLLTLLRDVETHYAQLGYSVLGPAGTHA